MKRVLILYGTRFGTTKDTSEKIRDILEAKEIKVTLVNIEEEQPSLGNFEGILIGTGIRISLWTKKIKKFIKKYKKDLEKRNFIFGFFLCCGTASTKEKIKEAKTKYIDNRMQKIGLTYDIADAFGGIYDFSETSPWSKMTKKMFKSGLINDEGWEHVEEILYDLRDLDQIQGFAEEFTTLL